MTIGIHSVIAQPASGPVDLSCHVDDVDVNHGRDDAGSQPDASSATINLDLENWSLPAAVDVGTPVTITTQGAGWQSIRFQGRITDITLGWDDAGPDTPNAGIGQIVAVGPLADAGRRVVGDAPFPQELDGARVSRVMALAGVTLDPLTSDPGTVQILARDIDSQSALDVSTGTAATAMGVLWETKEGAIRYADANHRRNIQPTMALDVCDVLVTPTWSRTLEGLINKVSLGYGVAPQGGEQPRVYYSDPDSIARYGTYDFSLETELALLNDAVAQAEYLVTMNGHPVWLMTDLPVAIKDLSDADTQTLLGLDMHSLILLRGLPVIADGGISNAHLWVEGWTEHLAWGDHEITLAVSGYCRTAPPPRWNDVLPSTTWDNVGTLTWNDISCLGPPVNIGRWDNVPASDRWNTLDPAITWDEWEVSNAR